MTSLKCKLWGTACFNIILNICAFSNLQFRPYLTGSRHQTLSVTILPTKESILGKSVLTQSLNFWSWASDIKKTLPQSQPSPRNLQISESQTHRAISWNIHTSVSTCPFSVRYMYVCEQQTFKKGRQRLPMKCSTSRWSLPRFF